MNFTRRSICSALGVLVISTAVLAAAAAAANVSVPAGATLKVHLTAGLSSSTAKRGQTFRVLASGPLVIDGWTAVAAGAVGQGVVGSASPAGKSGKQGKLALQFQWIVAADGSRLPLSSTEVSRNGKNKTGSSNAANIAGVVLLGPIGLFAHNFVKGKDVTVNPDHQFTVYVARTTTVRAARRFTSGQ